jgi:hypothetical protein
MWDLETIVKMNAKNVTAKPIQDTRQTATYRIHTENVDGPRILKMAAARFAGFTVFYGVGYDEGKQEFALVLEIITSDAAGVYLLAEEIRKANKQESVLVNRIESSARSVTREGLLPLEVAARAEATTA